MTSIWDRFKKDKLALIGLAGIVLLVAMALCAPLLANGRPLLLWKDGSLSFPFLRYLFAPDSSERTVEKLLNFCLLYVPCMAVILRLLSRRKTLKAACLVAAALLLALPFVTTKRILDKTEWRQVAANMKQGDFAVFAPVWYGPFENVASPYEKPSGRHLLGTDNIGRDVLSRVVYGARVSVAVGFLATIISLAIGTAVGLVSGYFGGKIDMVVMRVVEIIICFPSFLLLLILMAIMMDRKFEQSVLIVIPVIGLLGWTGLTRIVRGEVLKQRALQYVQSCEALGVPVWRIMFVHILPNVSGPIFVTAVFEVASNVLAESGLSFLGFGVQPPTASWGELLKEAFVSPLQYWHLTLWPGFLIFLTVSSFNLAGEGLRKVLDPKSAK